MKRKVAIIGGGAAGMTAAITAAREGADVTIYEHLRLGKKILATGNGKCNLSNLDMTAECFHSSDRNKVEYCLRRFGTKQTISFFESMGLCIKDKNGYLYPLAEQAAVVLQVLETELERQNVQVIYDEKVQQICALEKARLGRRVLVKTEKGKAFYDAVILACGSKAAPKTGSDGSGYDLAKELGHRIQPVLPSLVQLKCNDSFCKALAGIRSDAEIHIYDGQKKLFTEQGELQLTDYGISGIPVFQLSGAVNRYLYQNKKAELVARVDFLPTFSDKEYIHFTKRRLHSFGDNRSVGEFFHGMLNQKLMQQLVKLAGLKPEQAVNKADKAKLQKVFALCRGLEFHISGSNGFDNAQVCTGGVDMREVTDDLESVYVKNVYFAGELLDVDGRCGGYNLQWAWTSGSITGIAAALGR
ncbi:MAG: aminoacetone oxidase family FAD-binding enzyme [Lachnospiraceae bacterium]|nr:aminoacetone oxidase family FAD-binding enzyme [Lachnospiraceae bacterium]